MWSRRSLRATEFTNTKPAGLIPSQYFTVCIWWPAAEHKLCPLLGEDTKEIHAEECRSLMCANDKHCTSITSERKSKPLRGTTGWPLEQVIVFLQSFNCFNSFMLFRLFSLTTTVCRSEVFSQETRSCHSIYDIWRIYSLVDSAQTAKITRYIMRYH